MIERMKERAKLVRPLIIPLIFYLGLLAFANNWVQASPDSPWRIAVALTPMIPGVFIAAGVVHAILQLDELERRTLLEGIAVSFMGTLLLVISLGLLGIAGVPSPNGVYIGLVMVVLWLFGKLWATRRYQ